jgi:hypothetical protein
MKLALRLELSNGDGTPIEIRLSALGGRALVHNGEELMPIDEKGVEYANTPPKMAWRPVGWIRAVTDARSS